MPLISVPGIGYVRSEDGELERKLREGDGLIWKGDPTLELRYGILSAPRRMQHPQTGRWLNKGGLVAKRYEVWTVVDGREEMVSHWRLDEFDRILYDIAGMKASFEGRAPSTIEQIDANNAKIEKDASDLFREHYGAMLDHKMNLAHDLDNPKHTFRQVGGSDEKVDRNLAGQ